MTSFTPNHPSSLSLHLADSSLTPLVSSSNPETSTSRSLNELTTASLTAYISASRLGLGLPLGIMIETTSGGPLLMHSFLDPQPSKPVSVLLDVAEQTRSLSGNTEGDAEEEDGHGGGEDGQAVNGVPLDKGKRKASDDSGLTVGEEIDDESLLPPMLVATVVAPSHDKASDARKAVGKLEKVGAEFQRMWLARRLEEEEQEGTEDVGEEGSEDG